MLRLIIGILVIIIGLWQLYATYHGLQYTMKRGNAGASPFSLLAYFSSATFGVILLVIAFMILTNKF